MRFQYPEHISRLSDIITPYIYYDADECMMKLRDDAPDEVVQAKKERDEWAAKYKPHMEGCGD